MRLAVAQDGHLAVGRAQVNAHNHVSHARCLLLWLRSGHAHLGAAEQPAAPAVAAAHLLQHFGPGAAGLRYYFGHFHALRVEGLTDAVDNLQAVLRQAGGNQTRAALALGISGAALRKRMEELGVS